VLQFLAGKSLSATDHALHSPDLAQANFWLFPKLKACAERKAVLGS
jgi:hypothetical protein